MALPSRIYIGIDPGVGGAIGVLKEEHGDSAEFLDVIDMPTHEKKSGKREVDALELYAFAHTLDKISPPKVQFYVIVEQVSARPGQGVSSMFSFGDSYACARMIGVFLAAEHNGRYCSVAPVTWKKAMGVTDNKAYSRTLALRQFPAAADFLKRKKDEGRAESLLLALYGYRNRTKLF